MRKRWWRWLWPFRRKRAPRPVQVGAGTPKVARTPAPEPWTITASRVAVTVDQAGLVVKQRRPGSPSGGWQTHVELVCS